MSWGELPEGVEEKSPRDEKPRGELRNQQFVLNSGIFIYTTGNDNCESRNPMFSKDDLS